MKLTQFNSSLLKFGASSSLKKMDPDLLNSRISLLIDLSQSVQRLIEYTYFEEDMTEESIAYKIKQNQDLLLPSVKMSLFKKSLLKFWEERNG